MNETRGAFVSKKRQLTHRLTDWKRYAPRLEASEVPEKTKAGGRIRRALESVDEPARPTIAKADRGPNPEWRSRAVGGDP